MPLESFPVSSPSENGPIHAQFEHKLGTGKLGDLPSSVAGENENEVASSNGLEVPVSSPTFQSSRSGENHAQFASDTNGNLAGKSRGTRVHVPHYTTLRYQVQTARQPKSSL